MLLSVLHHSPQATAIYDDCELNIAYANQSMLDIWCADQSILGKTLGNCFPGFVQEGFCAILKNVWKTGISYRATDTPAHIVTGSTKVKRYFDFVYEAMVDADGQTYAILHTASDVTDRKLTYNRMEQQREELSLNHKLDLLANKLSHDLKNPLSVLKLGNDFLTKNEHISPPIAQRWYKNFADSIHSIESIINQTLLVSKVRGTKNVTECIAVDEKIGSWIKEVKMNYPDQEIEFRLGHLYPIDADMGAVYQIFTNLIANAVRYAIQADAYLYIYSETTAQGIAYMLEDNGRGISQNELDLLLNPQVQERHNLPNMATGIGLSVVKNLMEYLGGSMHVSSESAKGTVIRLHFPHGPEDC